MCSKQADHLHSDGGAFLMKDHDETCHCGIATSYHITYPLKYNETFF
jgi:hypothetical protein